MAQTAVIRQCGHVLDRALRGPHVLVTGVPGSGKSSLAARLADQLELPLLAKDKLRDLLFGALAVERHDHAERAKVGRAAVLIQFHLIRTMPSMVVDCGLWTDRSEPELVATGRQLIQVFCKCRFEVARERVRSRERWDSQAAVEEFERFRPLLQPLKLQAPLIVVSTESPVDIADVADRVRETWTAGSADAPP